MSYLHCHNCGWSQDDFWTKHYNPIRSLLDWEESLLEKDLNEPFPGDTEWVRRNGAMNWKEFIAREVERTALIIKRMKWRTHDDFRRDYEQGKANCPVCGSSEFFDID